MGDTDHDKELNPGLFIYRLDQAEKKLDALDKNIQELGKGFAAITTELKHVAKNEGKLSGGISGLVSSILVVVITIIIQAVMGTGK